MSKNVNPTKSIFIIGASLALLMLWTIGPSYLPSMSLPSDSILVTAKTSVDNCTGVTVNETAALVVQQPAVVLNCSDLVQGVDPRHDPVNRTFYDDPKVGYTIEKSIKNWDTKRRDWLRLHPSYALRSKERVFVVTGSQQWPCKSPVGDHLLLRLFKNKVDYCRINGFDLFYNNALLHPTMVTYWAKIPMVRAAMVAHPESEWIFWIDSDAVFTDMEFKPPLERYKKHNLVVDGWPNLIYEKKSWIAVNAGVFLIRNCQWSIDFLDIWANMGPKSPDYEKWGQILKSTLSDKTYPESDDQSALIYLLLKEKEKWAKKIYIENKYTLSGYWAGVVNNLEKIDESYSKIENLASEMKRRHAEKVNEYYADIKDRYIHEHGGEKRPFVTHFTGCQPCSGEHPGYTDKACWEGMEKVLNFADNQVLKNYGFVRPDIKNTSSILPLPVDVPA